VNLDYIVSPIYTRDISVRNIEDIKQDNDGLHWFQTLTEVFTFDGVYKRTYKFRSPFKNNIPFRINAIELLEDNTVLAATENGMYVFDRLSEAFIWIEEKFRSLKGMPLAVSCFYKVVPGKFIFTSALEEGFYLLDWNEKKFRHIVIDSITKAAVPYGESVYITSDGAGNVWGLTKENKGIWNYNNSTGKILCSWKGELPFFSDKRFQNPGSLNYSPGENVLWISHGGKGYLEKMNLITGKSSFYCFNGDLNVHPDISVKNSYPVYHVKTDVNNNEWVKVGEKYIVKLNKDLNRFEYLTTEKNLFSLGDWSWFKPENKQERTNFKNNNILLWINGTEKLSMIKKRETIVRHIPFDTSSVQGVRPLDLVNLEGRVNIFFEKGKNEEYFLLQQDEGRPKLICFDENLKIKKALFNDEWKQYPAFFSQSFDPDTLYIAFMRTGIEPLDFRNVIVKEFKVDLNAFNFREVSLSFVQRVHHYGYADADNIYWLFSNGTLYSYDPQKNILDSIYICRPHEKGAYNLELIKRYDYPTVLNKATSTYWIDFIPTRELYKINLKARKIEKIFKCCLNRPECNIPGGVFDMYNLDEEHIYLQQSFSALLINARNDSIKDYSEFFKPKLASQMPNGSVVYNGWTGFVLPSHIYFSNLTSGVQKKLTFNEDFKWPISQFNSKPLVNDHHEMILMSSVNKGFLVFNLDSIPGFKKPGTVQLSFMTLDNKQIPVDSMMSSGKLTVKFNKYNSIRVGFSDNSLFDPASSKYEYALYKGGDTTWSKIEGKPELTLSELSAGEYQLLLRAENGAGDHSQQATSFSIVVLPPYWQTWWFRGIFFAFVGLIFYGLYRYRIQQLKRLQIVRNNIASDLHDDIGSTLNSISIYSEVAKQQAGKDIPALEMIGINSRKIIENMSDIVWTINPENDSFEKIIIRMRSFAYQLLKAKKVEYTFEVDEKLNSILLPMQVRKNFYLVFKEAINNLVKYSHASRVSIFLTEKNRSIFLKIRDNGIGIPVNPETMGNGLMNMSRRAEEIHAELNIVSANGEGTEIELMLKT